MTSVRYLPLLTLVAANWLSAAAHAETTVAPAPAISFNRDIRPILSDKCFFCHGPDKNQRKADLRLDAREAAIEAKAIVPGKPDDSSLVERIFSDDPDELMPPPDSHKKLSPREKELFKRWIAEGAEYQGHWAYVLPKKPETSAGVNAIDVLVGRRLKRVGRAAVPRGGPAHADAPAVSRSGRPAAQAGRSRRLCGRFSRRTPTSGWSTGFWLRLITASGWRSAG